MAFRPAPKRPSLAHRLLDQKTVWQRALIAVTAVATAVTAVAGVVALLLPLFRPAPDTAAPSTPGPAPAVTRVDSAVPAGGALTPAGVTVVRTQTAEADALVRNLIATAGHAPVLLDHQIMGRPGPANVTLYYGCGSTASCAMTRIEVADLGGWQSSRETPACGSGAASRSRSTGTGTASSTSTSSCGRWATAVRPSDRGPG